jgi:hypothetical protein
MQTYLPFGTPVGAPRFTPATGDDALKFDPTNLDRLRGEVDALPTELISEDDLRRDMGALAGSTQAAADAELAAISSGDLGGAAASFLSGRARAGQAVNTAVGSSTLRQQRAVANRDAALQRAQMLLGVEGLETQRRAAEVGAQQNAGAMALEEGRSRRAETLQRDQMRQQNQQFNLSTLAGMNPLTFPGGMDGYLKALNAAMGGSGMGGATTMPVQNSSDAGWFSRHSAPPR